MISRRTGVWVLVGFTVAVATAAVLAPRIPQSQSYHDFADRRALLGIPNFGDVASNLLFAVSGAWGLLFLFAPRGHQGLSIHASDGHTSLFSWACSLRHWGRVTTISLPTTPD